MADRLLVELSADGRVSVGQWLEGELPDAGVPSELAWPLDEDALEELRWYLEDYLRAPFGVYGERGPKIEERLAGWGQAVFAAVFGSGAGRDAYVRMQARSSGVEVVFRAASPELLALPWELMRDPARPTPLALDLAGVSRSLPVAEAAETVPVPGGRLRVLMVISRPAGTGDVGYRMIARPLMDRLDAVRGQVDLVVLRPPTLDALGGVLAAAAANGRPFQVVHFDGHGALAGRRGAGAGAPWSFRASGPEGVLVFEKPGGGPDEVPASRVAQVLKAAQVPVVVLNACQSGAVGKDLEAAVATRLLQEGVASVVAMAYTVYAVAAAEFMTAFYERLFAGGTVGAAVTAGRQRLFQADLRPSPKGDMPLADWVVPVHYLRRDVSFPQAATSRPTGVLPLDAALDRLRESATGQESGSLDAVGSFVGRDALFFDLEAAARLRKVVVLAGPGGTGKTELAKAFGRWWRDTGGVDDPRLVFWHSFEPGVASFGLDGVITEIGMGVWGADFAALGPADRRIVVQNLLDEHRVLLIWDNFEAVASMPDPAQATPALDQAGQRELKAFLDQVARGRSAVIITSRTREDWLGDIRRISVDGLAAHEAAEYAGELLAPYPAAQPRRSRPTFGELMEWLDGHPLSMRLILPHLDTTDPEVLLDGLRGTAPLPGGNGAEDGRTTSLAASIAYSYHHLSADTRRRLAAISLFQGVTDADVLMLFSQAPGVPGRFGGTSREKWQEALNDAARVGLLTPLGGDMYQLHPALPGYLATQWAAEEPSDHATVRDAATNALLTAYAGLGRWLDQQINSGDAGMAFTIIDRQRRTIGSLLGYALHHQLWQEAQNIAPALHSYWVARGLVEEADAWTDRVRLATEDHDGTPPPFDTTAGALWLFIIGAQANVQVNRHRLDQAEETYQQILDSLQAQPASVEQQEGLAVVYHQLGMIARQRRRLDEAEEWNAKSLAIEEDLGNRPGMAGSYHELGVVALDRGRLDEAEDWYTKSWVINKDLGDQPHLARISHDLGIVAQLRGRLDEAEEWYTKALAIKEELGDRQLMATTYLQLGTVAQERGRLDEAEDWYTKALAIGEDLGDRLLLAAIYHQLGTVAQERGRLDEAEEWYTKSLTIEEDLGNGHGMARTFAQRGLLAEQRGQIRRALAQAIQAVSLFEQVPDPATGTAPAQLARLTAELGIGTLELCWREVTGTALPQAVRDYIDSAAHPGGT